MKKKLPIIITSTSSLIVILTVIFLNSSGISFFDSWFYKEMIERMNPKMTMTMIFITESGSSIAIVILCLGFFLFKKTRAHWAFPVTISVVSAFIANLLLKLMFARERPNILRLVDESSYSFPSGHAMVNMAFYTMVFLLAWRYIKNKKSRYLISCLCIIMPVLIGLSRIYLGVHYATDVIVGWLLGMTVSIIVFNFFVKKRSEV